MTSGINRTATLLHVATMNGDTQIVKMLVTCKRINPTDNIIIDARNTENKTALDVAIDLGKRLVASMIYVYDGVTEILQGYYYRMIQIGSCCSPYSVYRRRRRRKKTTTQSSGTLHYDISSRNSPMLLMTYSIRS